jgi:hypothetical protein
MDNPKQSKLTDFDNFWKIIALVSVAVVAEGIILWAATSDMAVNWTYDTVVAPRVVAQETVDGLPINEVPEAEAPAAELTE